MLTHKFVHRGLLLGKQRLCLGANFLLHFSLSLSYSLMPCDEKENYFGTTFGKKKRDLFTA